jgi:signal transduction histidine kinase
LTNVHRHSDSKIARIRVARNAHAIIIEVQDEGRGISPDRLVELQSQGGGVGIRGMRERVFQLGGELKIQSKGGGTTVSIALPFGKTVSPRKSEYAERSQAAE